MADEKVTNNLIVQGKEIRKSEGSMVSFYYKGEKLSDNEIASKKPYAVNDVVAVKLADSLEYKKITFEGETPVFNNYASFSNDIKDTKFENESVYYDGLNNAFNTCRITCLTLIDLLKDYSSTNDTLYKDSDYQVVSNNLKNSLENFIKYYFYEKGNLTSLTSSFVSDVCVKLTFTYNNIINKNTFGTSTYVTTFSTIVDSALRFDNTNNVLTLKHIARDPYYDYPSSNSSWGKDFNFPVYDLDERGHVISREQKTLRFPERNYLDSYVLANGSHANGELSGSYLPYSFDELKNFVLLEFVFKGYINGFVSPFYISVFVDTALIERNETVKFRGVSFSTKSIVVYDKYGNANYTSYTTVETSDFQDLLFFPYGKSSKADVSITYSQITQIIGYYYHS